MSTLVLNDGTRLQVLETSTPSSIIMEGDYATVSVGIQKITTDNLKNADLAGTILVNKVYTGFQGTLGEDGVTYTVTFGLRDKTDIETLYEMADETQQAIIELAQV